MGPTLLTVFLALIPILWLVAGLGIFRLPAFLAGAAGLVLAIICSVYLFGFPFGDALRSSAEGTVLAFLPILWAIIGAVYMYNIGVKTGYMERIKGMLSGISGDRRIQVLILAWAFSGFLEGAAGYGTAVAIPVSILMSLGMEPFSAAVVALIGNTAPTAFGAIGIPTLTLANLTGYPVKAISSDIALQLTPFILLLPFIMILSTGKRVSLRGVIGIALASGVSFAVINYLSAVFIGPELPALLGGIVTLGVILLLIRRAPGNALPGNLQPRGTMNRADELRAWSPYIILFLLIVATSSLFPALNSVLGNISSSFHFYTGPGGKPLEIRWILTPGTLLLAAALAGGVIQRASPRTLRKVFLETVWQLRTSIVTIVSIVALAKVMTYSGMITVLADAVAGFSGRVFPVFAPAIGALGTFLTGSDTSSNVLFAVFQTQTAAGIGVDPRWVAAANTSGAAIGKMISPQNIAIAAGAAGLAGREGDLFRKTLPLCAVFVAGLGLLVLAGALVR